MKWGMFRTYIMFHNKASHKTIQKFVDVANIFVKYYFT